MLGTGQLGTFQLGATSEEGTFGHGQARAVILGQDGYAQAQAYIKPRQGYGQAQALLNTGLRTAQAQARVSGITLVQYSVVNTTTTVTLAAAPQPGNLLIAFYASRNSPAGTTYSLNNGTWTLVSYAHMSGNGSQVGGVSYQIVPPGGLSASTTISGGSGTFVYGILEFSGINISDPLDVFGVVNANNGATSTLLTPMRAETLLFSFVANNRDAGNDFTPTSGMTELFEAEGSGGFSPQVEVNYQIVPMANGGSYSVGYTNFTNDQSLLIGVAFTGWTHVAVAQAQAWIMGLGFGLGQAQARTLQTYNGFGQAQALIDSRWGFGQAQAKIELCYSFMPWTYGTFGCTIGGQCGRIDFVHGPGSISASFPANWNGGVTWHLELHLAGGQVITGADVSGNTTAFASGTALNQGAGFAFITQNTNNGLIYSVGAGGVTYPCPIPTTTNAFGQAQATIIVQVYQPSAQAQAKIIAFGRNEYAQAQAKISTTRVYGQALAFVGHFQQGQAQAKINAYDYPQHGQAQAGIIQTYQVYSQANAWIIPPTVIAQAQADILQTYQSYAQAKTWIIPPTVIANAQARIIGFDIPRTGNVQALIKVTTFGLANAQGHIAKQAGLGLALARIKSSRNWARGQARALISGRKGWGQAAAFISKSAGYGQATVWIKSKNSASGQAQAYIKQTKFSACGQAQGTVLQTYQSYAQCQAQITITWRMAQAQSRIEQTYNGLAQALGRVKQTYRVSAQAQAVIKLRYYVHAQARARINRREFGIGQAQAYIKTFAWGQSQARILSFNYIRSGQAEGYILPSSIVIPPIPSSESHTYLVRYNNHDLPGYAQTESYNSIVNISTNYAMSIDGGLSEYTGLQNKSIALVMKAWEPTYGEAKFKVNRALTYLRSHKGFAKLYIQQPDAYFLALVRAVDVAKSVGESTQTLDYEIDFEAKPWLISNDTYEVSGTGSFSTINRTLGDGGWTPTVIIVSGTDIVITATTATGDPAGQISIEGTVTNLIIDTENFTATESGENRNSIIEPKNYGIYIGPGTTNFVVTGATSCVIQYQNRWYLSSNKATSTQPIATTPLPEINIKRGTGLAIAQIESGTGQRYAQARAVINDPIKKASAQAQALIDSPIKRAYAQARAFLRSGRTWTFAQANARIRVSGSRGTGQARTFVEGNTKTKSAQARATIRTHKQIKTGQARARIIGLPPAPSNLVATPGNGQVTITWS